MALYTVVNGGAIVAADANQYYNLLTGTTTDQPVTVTQRIQAALSGAATASGYVGGTSLGAPGSGTFALGDLVIDQKGGVWVCTAAGTPGTWQHSPTSVKTTTLGSSAASVTLSAIPAYNHLLVLWSCRSDTAAVQTNLNLRFNSDAGTNYITQIMECSAGTFYGTWSGAAAAQIQIGEAAAASDTTNIFATGMFTVPHWSSSSIFASPVGIGYTAVSTGASPRIGMYAGNYLVAAALTSMTFFPSAGSFITGTQFTVIGLM